MSEANRPVTGGQLEGLHEPRLGAVFGDRADAEAAVDELRRSGLADEHLGVAVHEADEYVFEEDLEAEMSHSLRTGVAIGAPIGAIAGMTLLALIVPAWGLWELAAFWRLVPPPGRWPEASGAPISALRPRSGLQMRSGTGSGSDCRKVR
jgi:hypothetical protein